MAAIEAPGAHHLLQGTGTGTANVSESGILSVIGTGTAVIVTTDELNIPAMEAMELRSMDHTECLPVKAICLEGMVAALVARMSMGAKCTASNRLLLITHLHIFQMKPRVDRNTTFVDHENVSHSVPFLYSVIFMYHKSLFSSKRNEERSANALSMSSFTTT